MKDIFRKLFWPILCFFEKGGSVEGYRQSHRKILLVVGFLFLVLSGVAFLFNLRGNLQRFVTYCAVFRDQSRLFRGRTAGQR